MHTICFLQPVTLITILLVLFVSHSLYVRFRPGLRQLPGPRLAAYSRLWNLLTASRGDAHETFQKLHQKYGKVVRTGPNHVAIADPTMIPVIYGTNNKFLKTDFYQPFSTPYRGETMHSMFSTPDPVQHKALKQAVSNKYSLSALREFEPKVNECTNIFVSNMREYASCNQIVDFNAWLQWYAFDVIGAISFNRRFGFMDERRDVRDIIAGIEAGLWYGCIIGQVPEFHPWLLGNNLARVCTKTKISPQMVEDAIERYDSEGGGGDRNDFLAWFRKEGEKSPDRMPHRDLMNHLMNNLQDRLAGSDTTAISLRAIFYYLIKNPRCYQKLLEELDAAEHEGRASANVTVTESFQMPYLQACMKEAMRLHPGVGFPLERYVPKGGLVVGDVLLPEGTIVGMNAWVIHHDKTIYGEDADMFRPERWMDAESEKLRIMEKCFLSFGAGTRTCIGKNISIMEMGMLVPQVLRNFEIEWAGQKKEWSIKSYWFAKQSGLHVRLRPRQKGRA
ncbi:hypothetical protein M430DRAFT_92974 [Amorphotheca resinae ATCC 22711]|uniref:Uncharacterized protein n=1 Tax=Amorphotheca resinae ATCC 22711 TaxID=857342 RepID=A0A2T3BGI0_AMORE|nr:hypothetical protein M430DRAFT_92974 [Amorphotheca resinae ATCC 22711]PSS28479.1 hypothetical protein M430DRAFT_92974 [Amorphotheca resinae ATCC 22711]